MENTNRPVEKNAAGAAVNATLALAEAIRTLGSVPSGHLYVHVMSKLSLGTYTSMIQVLKNAKLVSEEANVLTWIGPKVGG